MSKTSRARFRWLTRQRLPAHAATFNGETIFAARPAFAAEILSDKPFNQAADKTALQQIFYSAFGYEPSTLTKLHCCSSSAMAVATLRSVMWPSQSMKKKYSHAFRLLGRDSIF